VRELEGTKEKNGVTQTSGVLIGSSPKRYFIRRCMKRVKEQINAKSGFADPARIKAEREKEMPKDGKNSPWDFRCPQYDQRSSNFINAGTHYGIGIKQPVGHEGPAKQTVDVLPCCGVKTMRDDDRG
jgi:hypothetical protein